MTRRLRRAAAAAAAGLLAAALPAFTDTPAAAQQRTEWWRLDPRCDDWCRWRFEAIIAYERGDYLTTVWASALAYGRPEWANWMWATIGCETGGTLNPAAWSGYYVGWSQQDPYYWPARAAAAGLPNGDMAYGPDSAMVMASMLTEPGAWRHWPVCGANSWRPA